jgi:hypothetical protein
MKIDAQIVKNPTQRVVQKRFQDVSRAINGKIWIGSPSDGPVNQQGAWYDGETPSSPDTEFTFNHNLGYIPTGVHVISVDQAAIVYASRKSEWTTTQMFLKCNLASVNLQAFAV